MDMLPIRDTWKIRRGYLFLVRSQTKPQTDPYVAGSM